MNVFRSLFGNTTLPSLTVCDNRNLESVNVEISEEDCQFESYIILDVGVQFMIKIYNLLPLNPVSCFETQEAR